MSHNNDYVNSDRYIPNATDKEMAEDLRMLDLLQQYELTPKQKEFITFQFNRPEGRGLPFILNYISGRTGSAILHYENRYVKKLDVPDFNSDK